MLLRMQVKLHVSSCDTFQENCRISVLLIDKGEQLKIYRSCASCACTSHYAVLSAREVLCQ